MRIKNLAWGLSMAAMALLSACGGGGDDDSAEMRLLNASVGYASLDLSVGEDQTTVNSGVAYANVGSYASVKTSDSGTYIQNTNLGATLQQLTPTLSGGKKYTMIAYGTSGNVKATLLQDDQDNPDAGKSKFLILNLAPDAGALDIYQTTANSTGTDDAAAVATNLSSGSGTGYASLKSGSFRFVVTAAGDKTDVRLDIPSVSLPDAGVSTLVLTGSNGGLLVNGMQVIQQGAVTNFANTTARMRIVSGLPNSTIAASVSGTPLVAGTVASPVIGTYTKVAAANASLSLTVNGVTATSAPALVAGNDYTVMVYGNPSAPTTTLLSDDNKLPTTSTNSRIRLINALSNSSAALNLTVNYLAYGSNVTPGQSSTPLQIAAMADVPLTVTSATGTLFSQADTDIIANNVYTVFVLGDGSAPNVSLRRER